MTEQFTPEDVEAVAKGLTRAQASALLAIDRPYSRIRSTRDRLNLKSIMVGEKVIAAATMAALMDAELAWAFGSHVGLLSRGEKVRAYLQNTGGDYRRHPTDTADRREAIARIIYPEAFDQETPQQNVVYRKMTHSEARCDAFAKADAILSLIAGPLPDRIGFYSAGDGE